jgi:hypothetical protein
MADIGEHLLSKYKKYSQLSGHFKPGSIARCQCLTPVILANWEAEIRRN